MAVPDAEWNCACREPERIHQPRPRDIGEHRVDADIGLERCLRETDDPPRAVPGGGLVGVVEQDEAPCAVRGVDACRLRPHVPGQGKALRRQTRGRRNLAHRQIVPENGRTDVRRRTLERRRRRRGTKVCHAERLEWGLDGRLQARRDGRPLSRTPGRSEGCTRRAERSPRSRAVRRSRSRLLRMARRVVTPAVRVPDTRILSLDTAAQTITLERTADTQLPGRYGLFTSGTETYIKLGSVLAEDATSVKRKLLTADRRADADLCGGGIQRLVLRPCRTAPPALHLRADRIGRRPVPGLAVPCGGGRGVGDPGARTRDHEGRVPARGAGVPRRSASPHSWSRTATTARRRAVAPAPTRSGRRSGVTWMRPSGSPDGAARGASC